MRLFLIPVLALSLFAPAIAHARAAPAVTVRNATLTSSLKGAPTTEGFLVAINASRAPDRLLAVRCDCAAKVSLHHMWTDRGIMRMRLADGGLALPAHGVLALSAGGDHLMFERLSRQLKPGDRVRLTLIFAKAGELKAEAVVRGLPGAMSPAAMKMSR